MGLQVPSRKKCREVGTLHRMASKATRGHRLEWFGNAGQLQRWKDEDEGGEELMSQICEEFGKNIKKHIDVYGAHNEQRLTGLHATQSIH